jgi:hypothetical protein
LTIGRAERAKVSSPQQAKTVGQADSLAQALGPQQFSNVHPPPGQTKQRPKVVYGDGRRIET